MDILYIIISLVAGVAAGFMAAITSGSGILLIPLLIFLGLPANSAIATNALPTIGLIASSLPRYYKANKVQVATGLKLIPLAIVGGIIGSKALVRTDADALTVVVGILLLLMIPLILLNPKKGIKVSKESRNKVILGYAVYFLTMVYGGFLGAGAGMFAMYALVYFLGMTYLQAKSTISLPGIFMVTAVFIVFLTHGLVNFKYGIPMTIGAYIGGAWGARTAIEKGDAWVRMVFVAVVATAGIKLLFFP